MFTGFVLDGSTAADLMVAAALAVLVVPLDCRTVSLVPASNFP